jgi:hypothetical protein
MSVPATTAWSPRDDSGRLRSPSRPDLPCRGAGPQVSPEMAGVLTRLIAVGHHRSLISLIRLALSLEYKHAGIWVILGCEMLIGRLISGNSRDASVSLLAGHAGLACHVLTRPSLANAFFRTRPISVPTMYKSDKMARVN